MLFRVTAHARFPKSWLFSRKVQSRTFKLLTLENRISEPKSLVSDPQVSGKPRFGTPKLGENAHLQRALDWPSSVCGWQVIPKLR